jgi:hypothetical protein
MIPHSKVSLKSIEAPLKGGAFISAPPILNATDHTTAFCCCNCDTILLHAEADQVFGLTIRCTNCGSFNTTNT